MSAIDVKLNVFEGPLDLLLHLMEKNKVNFKIEMNLPVHYSNKCTKYILISILEIKNIPTFQD